MMAHKSPDEVSAFERITQMADEVIDFVHGIASTPDSAVVTLGIAVGKLCAKYDISVGPVHDIIDVAYNEYRRQYGG